MKKFEWRGLCGAALALGVVSFNCAAETVRVGGTGSAEQLIQSLGEAFHKTHPDVQISVINPPLGSGGGLRAVADGDADIAVTGRVPKHEEATNLGDALAWVKTPLVFAGRDLPDGTDLTRRQVADIYSGRQLRWRDGRHIRLVLRAVYESDTILLRALSQEVDAAVALALQLNRLPVAEDDAENMQLLEQTPGSLGILTLGYIRAKNSPLKVAKLDGVMPTAKALSEGRYGLEKTIYLVTGKAPSPATRSFVAYLRSPAAAKLLASWDYLFVNPQAH